MLSSVVFLITGIILTIFIIIGIHELGHFTAARCLNIPVVKFSIGFGRELLSFRDKKNTKYTLALIPLGGYVSLLEENNCTKENQHMIFTKQSYWKRFLVIAAGPIANFLLALALYWTIFIVGFTSILPITGKITPNSIAENAGIKINQQIYSVDNRQVKSWAAVMIRTLDHMGHKDNILIKTHPIHNTNKISEYILNLKNWKMDDLKPNILESLGITPWQPKSSANEVATIPKHMFYENKYGPIEALMHAWQNTRDFTLLNIKIVYRIITGKISLQTLGGPISIFGVAGNAVRQGGIAFMSFLAFISISIGLINVFPIPGLDGGHLFFQTIEAIFRKPIPARWMGLFYRIGIIFIILISIQAIINDLMRLGN